jgi:hypothetical protein
MPDVYRSIQSMCIEAGVRGHMAGIDQLAIEMLAAGRPIQVQTLFERFCARYREIKGVAGLELSVKRKTRVEGRLKHDSHQQLSAANILAHTMLNQFTATDMIDILQAGTALSNLNHIAKRIFRKIKVSYEIRRKFWVNLERLDFARKCYHNNALILAIGEAEAQGPRWLMGLYNEVVNACIGPDAILVPTRVWDISAVGDEYKREHVIRIPVKTWGKCLAWAPRRILPRPTQTSEQRRPTASHLRGNDGPCHPICLFVSQKEAPDSAVGRCPVGPYRCARKGR